MSLETGLQSRHAGSSAFDVDDGPAASLCARDKFGVTVTRHAHPSRELEEWNVRNIVTQSKTSSQRHACFACIPLHGLCLARSNRRTCQQSASKNAALSL